MKPFVLEGEAPPEKDFDGLVQGEAIVAARLQRKARFDELQAECGLAEPRSEPVAVPEMKAPRGWKG